MIKLKKLDSELTKLCQGCKAVQASYYNTKLSMTVELPAPVLKKYFKEIYQDDQRELEDRLHNWLSIWQSSDNFYVLSLCCLFLEAEKDNFTECHWSKLKNFSDKVENWVHSDKLSGVYAYLHEKYPKLVYKTYEGWAKSPGCWKRRLSIIGLFYYSGLRKQQPAFTKVTKLLIPQIKADEYYLQKAVGWTFRELYNAYPEKTYSLLQEYISILPAAAWQAATEKLSRHEKSKLKQLRKEGRVNGLGKGAGKKI